MGTLGRPMTSVLEDTLRAALLKEVGRFVERARHLAGVERIALIGSLTTPKEHPKDADVLTTISNDVDLAALATVARKLKGAGQRRNSGADVFLCNKAGDYLGRTCSYRNATRGWPVAEGSVPFPPTSVTTSMRSAWRND